MQFSESPGSNVSSFSEHPVSLSMESSRRECQRLLDEVEKEIQGKEEQIRIISGYPGDETLKTLEQLQTDVEGLRVSQRKFQDQLSELYITSELQKQSSKSPRPVCLDVQMEESEKVPQLLLTYSFTGTSDEDIEDRLRWLTLMIERNKGPMRQCERCGELESTNLSRVIKKIHGVLDFEYRVLVSLPPTIDRYPLGTLKLDENQKLLFRRTDTECVTKQ